jgi:hypothetical protein
MALAVKSRDARHARAAVNLTGKWRTAVSSTGRDKLGHNGLGDPQSPVGRDDIVLLRQALMSLTEEVRGLRQEVRTSLVPQWKPKPSYTVGEVAQRLGRSAYTIRRWIKEDAALKIAELRRQMYEEDARIGHGSL